MLVFEVMFVNISVFVEFNYQTKLFTSSKLILLPISLASANVVSILPYPDKSLKTLFNLIVLVHIYIHVLHNVSLYIIKL